MTAISEMRYSTMTPATFSVTSERNVPKRNVIGEAPKDVMRKIMTYVSIQEGAFRCTCRSFSEIMPSRGEAYTDKHSENGLFPLRFFWSNLQKFHKYYEHCGPVYIKAAVQLSCENEFAESLDMLGGKFGLETLLKLARIKLKINVFTADFSDESLKYISELPGLERLSLNFKYSVMNVTDEGLGLLHRLPLKTLSLQFPKSFTEQLIFMDNALQYFADTPIEVLSLTEAAVTDECFKVMSKIQTLKHLYISLLTLENRNPDPAWKAKAWTDKDWDHRSVDQTKGIIPGLRDQALREIPSLENVCIKEVLY